MPVYFLLHVGKACIHDTLQLLLNCISWLFFFRYYFLSYGWWI